MEPLYRLGVVRRLLEKHDLKPTKSLGQNFLVDKNTLERIVTVADVTTGDTVVEIGPGLGTLTQALLLRGAHVIAIEKDERLVSILSELFPTHPRLSLLHQDALAVDLAAATATADEDSDPRALKVVSNLPYYVTSPLLMHILEAGVSFERIVVMIQHEVAARLLADPGTKAYGALTVAVSFYADVESAGVVPPTVFYPEPAVSSHIVKLIPRPCPVDVGRKDLFFQVVRAAFGQRRKTLSNALKELPHDRQVIQHALKVAGIEPGRRGETLSLAEFAKVSAALSGI